MKNDKLNQLLVFLKNKKTSSLKVIDISKISIIADYFVIVSVETMRNVNSLEDEITDFMLKQGFEYKNKEGVHTKWVLIDYNDIIIHIFDDEYKDFYSLDKLWADGEEVDIENLP